MIKSLLIIILSGLLSGSVFAQDQKSYSGTFKFAEGEELISVSIYYYTPKRTTCYVTVKTNSAKYVAFYELTETEETDDFMKSATLFKYMKPKLFSVGNFFYLAYNKKTGTLSVQGLPHDPSKTYRLKKDN